MSCNCHNQKGQQQTGQPSRERYEYNQNQPKVGPNGQPYTLQGKSSFKPATTEYYQQADYHRSRAPTEQEKQQNVWNGVM
jgi:hypothetical protein